MIKRGIAVIIPVFNRAEYTKLCLESLLAVDHGAVIQPIIVDCGSRSRTRDIIKDFADRFTAIHQIQPIIVVMPINKGFAVAVNEGLRVWTEGINLPDEKMVILHNDTVVFPNWLGEMVACADECKDNESLVWMPRTNYSNESSVCIPDVRSAFEAIKPPNKERLEETDVMRVFLNTYAGVDPILDQSNMPSPNELDKAFKYHNWLLSFMDRLKSSQPRFSYSHEISCFCMMTKVGSFREFGKFDEEFFPRGFEDKLWFLKAERQGYCCQIANRAYVHHFGNITSDGPGYTFPDVMRINEQRYNLKVEELNKHI